MLRACRPGMPRLLMMGLVWLAGIGSAHAADTEFPTPVKPGTPLARTGDEVVVCGQLFHTGGAPVVLWTDPGGYDAYRVTKRFSAEPGEPKARYGQRRTDRLSDAERAQLQDQGWSLPLLQKVVDQFVIHYDVCGTARRCFQVLQDGRDLSVHFMLDVDGTIYQTLDLKESAWHATKANGRSIGIEIANMGAYSPRGSGMERLAKWYVTEPDGRVKLNIADPFGAAGVRNKNFTLRPDRDRPVIGTIQGSELAMYDLTPQQYEALIKLTATLSTVFPKIKLDVPRDDKGNVLPGALSDKAFDGYEGVLGHYHVQTNKTDPGPAFQWDWLLHGARTHLGQ
jgi:N-acetylmuramoyl-L-alanine amidase